MKFTPTSLADVILIEPVVYRDSRGYFMETYREDIFNNGGINANFVQDNQAKSTRGVLRGLHYQLEYPQGKLIRVLQGDIFDVAVDIRKSSPNFGKWVGEILSAENKKQLYIPPGFAHGYCVLSEDAEITYKCTEIYHKEDDRGIIWNDDDIRIEWPIENPILSEKDLYQPKLRNAEVYKQDIEK